MVQTVWAEKSGHLSGVEWAMSCIIIRDYGLTKREIRELHVAASYHED